MMNEIQELLTQKDYMTLRSTLMELQAADIAVLLNEFPEDDIPILFRLLPKETAAECFAYLESDVQETLINVFSDRELWNVISGLFVDDMVDMIEEMPANVVKRIIKNTPYEKREQVNMILRYPKNSAGTIMTTEFVELKAWMTREQVFRNIRESGVEKETVYDCYVTDPSRHLIGVISVKDLIMSEDENATVDELMETEVITANVLEDRESVVGTMKKYGFVALPVTDGENRLVGIVTSDDALTIIEDESTEDIEIMAAITPSEKTYFKTTVFETWKKRIPWLLFLMISSVFTSKILQYFEGQLTANGALIAFMPMLMGTAGNAGGQVSVTIIRSLSIGEVHMSDILKIVWKEFRVSILCGITLAAVNFLKMLAVDNVTIGVALTVSVTISLTVVVAKFIGGILPVVAKRIGFDPAVMASPFITTICDAVSLLLYFRAASLILGI